MSDRPYVGTLLRQTPSSLGNMALQAMADAASAALAMMNVPAPVKAMTWEKYQGVETVISADQRVRIIEQYQIGSDTWVSRVDVAR